MDKKQRLALAVERETYTQKIVDNPIYREAMLNIKAKLFNDLCRSKWIQIFLRQEIWRQLRTLDKMEAIFLHEMNTGKIARKEIEKMSKKPKRGKSNG